MERIEPIKSTYALSEVTLWELAHRLAGYSPYRVRWLPLPSNVKDMIRLLVCEIYHGRLVSNLIYEKQTNRHSDSPEFYIRHHLGTIFDILPGKRYPRRFLNFVSIERYDFAYWCEQTGFELPPFWYALDTSWEYADVGSYERWVEAEDERLRDVKPAYQPPPNKLAKQNCIALAKKLWEANPARTITDIAGSPEFDEIAGHWAPDTRRKWIAPYAPDEIKGRRGRPKKAETNRQSVT